MLAMYSKKIVSHKNTIVKIALLEIHTNQFFWQAIKNDNKLMSASILKTPYKNVSFKI